MVLKLSGRLSALQQRARERARAAIFLAGRLPVFLPCLLAAGWLWALPVLQGDIHGAIASSEISPESGFAFTAPVVVSTIWPTRVWGSEVGVIASGRMELFEDRVPLGPDGTQLDLIRNHGRGSYSYWGKGLYFSSSDGSDPRANGRHYEYRVAAALPPLWFKIGVLLAFAGAIGALRSEGWAKLAKGLPSHAWLINPRTGATRPLMIQNGAMLLAVSGAIALVCMRWRSGDSSNMALSGFLPVSDALGYYGCALFVVPDMDWCGRRDLYPLALHTLLTLSGGRAGVALVLQAAVIGIGVAALSVAVLRTYGLVAALVTAIGTMAFAYHWCLANFMTEAFGFPVGLVAGALVITYCQRRSPHLLVMGIATVGLALSARAGAMFVLPLVALWGYWYVRPTGRVLHIPSAALVIGACMFGPALHVVGAWHLGADIGNAGGNFATSLYGLSTGSRDWSQAYRDFAVLFHASHETSVFPVVRDAAIRNILAHPDVFLDALRANEEDFVGSLFGFVGDRPMLNRIATAFLILGALRCALRWRSPLSQVVLLVGAGELLSASLIFDSAGQRGFAATVWIRPLLAGIGARFAVEIVFEKMLERTARGTPVGAPEVNRGRLAVLSSGVLILLPCIAMLPSLASQKLPTTSRTVECSGQEFSAVTLIGHESMAIAIDPEARTSLFGPFFGPLRLPPGLIEHMTARSPHWYTDHLGNLPPGSTIIYGFDRREGVQARTTVLYWPGPEPIVAGGFYGICAGEPQEARRLGDLGVRTVTRIFRLD